ncbi:phenazine biosynthesis protein [Pseudomonas aeruginosa]|uniref:phenazine biosynthesis protein n=1 Tax=Pseudomonas aeruginosa TaxID=287 RepID=UPI0022366B12|nr:phenazine biosynthesis protein [Pseudomonas aeruginosa]
MSFRSSGNAFAFYFRDRNAHGKILFPGYPEGYYENHFLHSFELEDGKIKRNREFMNVFQQLRALSIPVPQIKREGIPT